MGQPGRPPHEAGVGQRPRPAGHRDRVGLGGRPGGDELLDPGGAGDRRRRVVPVRQHPGALVGRQQGQARDGPARVGGDRRQQHAEVSGQPVDGGDVEQGGAVLDLAGNVPVGLAQGEREVDLRGPRRQRTEPRH